MKADKFKQYLQQSGAEILEPTNPYEVVRFRTVNGVSIIYKNKRGSLTFTGEAEEAYERMERKSPWTIISKGLKQKRKTLAEIIRRDGTACFFCAKETTEENRTLEHLLAVIHGGSNNPANLVIACNSCNQSVGNMPIIDKIKYRETLRGCP